MKDRWPTWIQGQTQATGTASHFTSLSHRFKLLRLRNEDGNSARVFTIRKTFYLISNPQMKPLTLWIFRRMPIFF